MKYFHHLQHKLPKVFLITYNSWCLSISTHSYVVVKEELVDKSKRCTEPERVQLSVLFYQTFSSIIPFKHFPVDINLWATKSLSREAQPDYSRYLHEQTRCRWYNHLDCLFLCDSSMAKIWMVPWSLATHISEESLLKLMLRNKNSTKYVSYACKSTDWTKVVETFRWLTQERMQ